MKGGKFSGNSIAILSAMSIGCSSSAPLSDGASSSAFDSHCHVRRAAPGERIGTSPLWPGEGNIRGALVCGTHPLVDWDIVDEVATQAVGVGCEQGNGQNIFVGFGVHPWYVPLAAKEQASCITPTEGPSDPMPAESSHCCSELPPLGLHEFTVDSLLDKLEEKLIRHPTAWVGEIGLDKVRPPNSAGVQMAMFIGQLKLAAKHNRPVSVHCVRSFGQLLDVLTKLPVNDFPPAVVLHGYSGSADFAARSLLSLPKKKGAKIYFGVGANTTMKKCDSMSILANIPRDRLLFESDEHWVWSSSNEQLSDVSKGQLTCVDAFWERHGQCFAALLGLEKSASRES